MTLRQRRRRSDAERSITAIVDAAVDVFAKDPEASMTHIATAAGVGRVTLYSHFPSRDAVLKAVMERVIADAAATLDAVGMGDDDSPAEAILEKWLRTSWHTVDRYGRIRVTFQNTLGWERLRAAHDPVFAQVERLLVRGQKDGVFRDDLPLDWLVSTVYVLVHGAADQVDAGRVAAHDVPDLLIATVLSALRPPR